MTSSSLAAGRNAALTDHILSDRLDGAAPDYVATLQPVTGSTPFAAFDDGFRAVAATRLGTDASAAFGRFGGGIGHAASTGYVASTMPLPGGLSPLGTPVIGPIRPVDAGTPGYRVSDGQTLRTAFPLYALNGIEDPVAAQQWHLTRLGNLNAVWKDYTGKDVHVGVYDSGVQYDHWDLASNYDASREVVIDGYKYDGDYRPASGPHGTSVAGLIAAARNGQGGVGVSYDAKLTGINIFDPYSEDDSLPGVFVNAADPTKFFEAVWQSDRYDVANHSWGGRNTYTTDASRLTEGSFGYEMVRAVAHSAEVGRDGLGTIHVAAAGNDRLEGQSDTWKTDRHTFTIGAYRESDGMASYYVSGGAHLLVSAPSNDFSVIGGTGQVTVDLLGRDGYNTVAKPGGKSDYTDDFGGTSGAAPIVSGVVSLMLDANENLGWRDVKDILAYSAKLPVAFETGQAAYNYLGRQLILNHSPFELNGQQANWNGGATHFSNDYGYGAVDAYNAVRMAEVWSLFGAAKTSHNEAHISTGDVNVGLILPVTGENDRYTFRSDFVGTPKSFTFDVTSNIAAEHLDLTINWLRQTDFDGVTYDLSMFGLKIKITAPDGTTGFIDTSLLPNDWAWTVPDGAQSFTFGLSGFRGVETFGTWTAEFEQIDGDLGESFPGATTINSLKLDAYGSAISTSDVYTYTDEFLTMAAITGEGKRRTLTDSDGGTDWINAAAVTKDVSGSMVEGQWFNFGGVNAFKIARGTQIENIVTGDGNDTITGNALDNEIHGMRGNDILFGGAGNDRLYGGEGDDRLDGGTGADLLDGGTGNDTYVVDNVGDVVVERADAGIDTVYAAINYTLTANVENLYLTGSARIGTGNDLDNRLFGTGGNDTLYGGAGDDWLKGWAGNDTLYGGAGNDRLEGAEGNDWLDGGTGADYMEGGIGNDTYIVDNVGDQVVEWHANGLGGIDSVYASIDYTLGNNVENLYLTGSADLNGTGNALANIVRGNGGANVLRGGAGNDTLIGLGGNDTLYGGAGADTFVFGAGFGQDVIGDFGAGDTIDLSTYQLDRAPIVTEIGSDTLIDVGDGNTILLIGIDPDQLSFTGSAFGFVG